MSEQRVVVGVDGSSEARAALRWAIEEARIRNARLEVVHAWDAPWHYWDASVPMPMDTIQQQQEKLLDDEVQSVCADFPDVKIEKVIVNDLPARALLDRSKGADLVVVGSRGRGGFAGLLMGSVSQQIVNHAECPVVVLPVKENS